MGRPEFQQLISEAPRQSFVEYGNNILSDITANEIPDWELQAPSGKIVEVNHLHFDMQAPNTKGATAGSVTVRIYQKKVGSNIRYLVAEIIQSFDKSITINNALVEAPVSAFPATEEGQLITFRGLKFTDTISLQFTISTTNPSNIVGLQRNIDILGLQTDILTSL